MMGDSITRGQGAPFGGTFEALLEQELDRRARDHGPGKGVEILNFAVGSYNITQQMEMGRTRAVRFDPDVYVYCLSPLSVGGLWARHLALLVNEGIDLKYDFLRKVITEADVRKNDPVSVFATKLAKYRLPTTRWALSEMKTQAEEHHARMLVLLVPETTAPSQMAEAFVGLPEMLKDLDIPYISLANTFAGLADLAPYRVADNDLHPNAKGHELIYKNLLARLDADPQLKQILSGP
jgi:hypothetical protein